MLLQKFKLLPVLIPFFLMLINLVFCMQVVKAEQREYQVEIILFNNLGSNNSLSKQQKEHAVDLQWHVNKHNAIDFQLKSVKPEFLLHAYNKLNKDPNYKVFFYSASKYNLLPSQKIKKFFISSKSPYNANYVKHSNIEDFMVTLIINKNKNIFNVMFDGIVNQSKLKKICKLKSKEIYYFDHQVFGALLTIVD